MKKVPHPSGLRHHAPVIATDERSFLSIEELLEPIVRHVTLALRVDRAYITTLVGAPAGRARTLAGCVGGQPVDPFDYDLVGTPCAEVIAGEVRFLPSDVQRAYPGDARLAGAGCQAFVGVPIAGPDGASIGHLLVMHGQPLDPGARAHLVEVLQAFAASAAVEMERSRVDSSFLLVMTALANVSGDEFLRALAPKVAEAMQMRYALIAEYREHPPKVARATAFWTGAQLAEVFEYELAGTPCSIVAHGEVAIFQDKLMERFPQDRDLVELGAQSYIGIPIFDASGRPIGHLAVLDTKPAPSAQRRVRYLRLMATRLSAELMRLRAESAVQETAARLRLVVEHAADPLLMYEPGGTLVDVNPAACESVGFSREELVGKGIELVRVGASGEVLASELARLRASGTITMEVAHRRRDGSTFDVEARLSRIELGGKELIFAAARDITERKRAEALTRVMLREMSTPILRAWDGVLVLPVVGTVDAQRAADMMEALLGAIVQASASIAILDLTGVRSVDAATAGHLLTIVRAAALLGSQSLISGISPSMARTLVELGHGAEGFTTFGTLQSALEHAISRTPRRARAR
jgi:PAS domain S-box-containing protein